ncbi:hypothetical protein AOXY_G6554 [Acipenser oxyrinchus oxyrinchus]|uniref:Cystatin domain-containing protein n=1 Tax=Acipenser oxyrinchus oxyrinchus TaxID=40147 RepID=A0AAD8LPW6_ACIOX|nr:hypothetical protein AOXY_G6554 [Acipenser oxyrinchus oxyrinchus]
MASWWHYVLLVLTVSTASAEQFGGLKEASLSSPGVLKHRYSKHNIIFFVAHYTDIFIGVIQQVVAGVKYFLAVEMGLTQCKKGESNDVKSCTLNNSVKKFTCHFVILDVPWFAVTQLLESSCKPGQG